MFGDVLGNLEHCGKSLDVDETLRVHSIHLVRFYRKAAQFHSFRQYKFVLYSYSFFFIDNSHESRVKQERDGNFKFQNAFPERNVVIVEKCSCNEDMI